MSHSDALVGQTLNELADSPFADDTYVALVSDGTDPNEFTNLAGDPAFAPVKAQLAAMV